MRYLQNIALFSTLLPFVFYFVFQRNNKNKELRVIFFYLLYSILNDGVTWYLFEIAKFKAYLFYDILSIVELAVFFLFISKITATQKLIKYLPATFIIFVVFCIIDYAILRKSKSFNSAITGVEAVLIITLCLYYFYGQLKEPDTLLIYTTQNFWIIIAFMIYFSGTFFLYIYAESTLHDKIFRFYYVLINCLFIIIKNILLSIALLIKPENMSESTFPNKNLMSSDWGNVESLKM